MSTQQMSVGDILTKAAEVIDERGWCQDTLEDEQGRVCAIGSLNVVLTGDAYWWWTKTKTDEVVANTTAAALAALRALSPSGMVAKYNNAPGRTVEEIKEWFAKAAANAGTTRP